MRIYSSAPIFAYPPFSQPLTFLNLPDLILRFVRLCTIFAGILGYFYYQSAHQFSWSTRVITTPPVLLMKKCFLFYINNIVILYFSIKYNKSENPGNPDFQWSTPLTISKLHRLEQDIITWISHQWNCNYIAVEYQTITRAATSGVTILCALVKDQNVSSFYCGNWLINRLFKIKKLAALAINYLTFLTTKYTLCGVHQVRLQFVTQSKYHPISLIIFFVISASTKTSQPIEIKEYIC